MIRPALTEIGIFLIPFGVYALFLLATRSAILAPSSWPIQMVARHHTVPAAGSDASPHATG